MDDLQSDHIEPQNEQDPQPISNHIQQHKEEDSQPIPTTSAVAAAETTDEEPPILDPPPPPPPQAPIGNKTETEASEDLSESLKSLDDDEEDPHPKKQKHLSSLITTTTPDPNPTLLPDPNPALPLQQPQPPNKKSKKKNNNNVWVTKSTRKGKKKTKPNGNNTTKNPNLPGDDKVLVTPVARFPDKSDDSPDATICLSKSYKAEKVELSEDRMSAASTKGYRMVRATRGVVEGAWYFEIRVMCLGETGHTRLGWSTEKGDLQAPVGYDGNSFGYRDVDGSKVHKALREKYGDEGYEEGDVIGFYINLPDGGAYAPKPPHLVWYKGQRYATSTEAQEDAIKVVPGSEISFFKNGVCQGVAFKDICGGRYYPVASMYTLPHQPNCVVKFNFGPDFEFFPEDFDGRPHPKPMAEVPYHGFENRVENGD